MSQKNLFSFLQQLGVSETETTIYLKLLEIGPSQIADVTKIASIPRTTVRENLDKLIKKGLVTQTIKGVKKLMVAEEPTRIKYLLSERKIELENETHKVEEFEKMLPKVMEDIAKSIPSLAQNTHAVVKFYEGKNEVSTLYKESIEVNTLYSIAHLESYFEVYPDTQLDWNAAFAKNPKREVWDILLKSDLALDIHKNPPSSNYHSKVISPEVLKGSINTFSDYLIFNNKVAIIQLDKINTFATVIESSQVHDSLQSVHRALWNLL